MMRTVVIPPMSPAAPAIDADTVRARLGITDVTQDAALTSYIAAATAMIDGPDGWLGRSILPQTLQLQSDSFPWYGCHDWRRYSVRYEWDQSFERIRLLCPPISTIQSVTYLDGAGALQTLDPSSYELDGSDLSPIYGTTWPSAEFRPRSVKITYTAGYVAGQVPAPIIQAIVLQVAAMNSMMRADILSSETVVGVYSRAWAAGGSDSYDKAAMALLAPYRVIDR